ncbi:MAG: indole-3-glycerol phosphate synthase TrpC [Candidatus Dormibacteria bacterium]
MADLLEGIVARVRAHLLAAPPDEGRLRDAARERPSRRDFAAALAGGPEPALIAEFKRRSPSKGDLRAGADVAEFCGAFARAGASAISVLTNPDFGGDLRDLRAARKSVELPLLRKDFVIDPRQVLEAAAAGADCVLLITRIVSPAELLDLSETAAELGLQTLVEVYEESELEAALGAGPTLLGVNSRDLATFAVDSGKFARIAAALPEGLPMVAESGVSSRKQAVAAARAGARAVLVGEALMTAPDPATKVRELVGAAQSMDVG